MPHASLRAEPVRAPASAGERAVASRRCAEEWEQLEPRGFYARVGRPLFHGSVIALVLPVVAAFALGVALIQLVLHRDPRRILFVQSRVGRRGRVFRIFKFRTMRDAPTSVYDSWSHGLDRQRVTRFGRFLRNSHLDELPQMLNVLRGDMSLIGPRPEMVEIEAWASEHVPEFSTRLVLRPGITGLAQITQGYTGRSVEAYAEKLRWNELYRERLSFRTDLAILVGTVLWMVRGRGWQWNQTPSAQPASGAQEPNAARDGSS